jgi:large subunit ribosomal protein L30
MAGSLRVTLRKSPISYTAKARGTLRALGLRRIGQSVEVADNPQTRGMARAVRFLVELEEIEGGAAMANAPRKSASRDRAAPSESSEDKQAAAGRVVRRSRADEAS